MTTTHPTPIAIHVVSHTHWDREWYLPAGRFRQRLVALIDDLLDRAPQPGESFLLDGQAVVLEDYLAVRPERRELIGTRLRAGNLEAGPWFVLADELIPSGEALVRNLLAGRAVLRALGAEAPPVLYSPDAFGHPAALPALAAGFGLPLIVLWRGLGGPSWPSGDTFCWRAPDGTEVPVYHLPPDGYEYGSSLPAEDEAMRERWSRLESVVVPRTRSGVALLLNGADHHARQPDLERALDALARSAAPHRVLRSSLREFARDFAQRGCDESVPRICGELRNSYGYTWTLQGTFATRAHLKRRNAALERLLTREAEPWSALAGRASGRSRRHLLQAAWKTLLLCHPHDTLCGCSTDEVARAMSARMDDAESQARGVRDDALLDLVGHDPAASRVRADQWQSVVLVRNSAARRRGGVAELDVALFRQHVPVGPGSGSAQRAEHAPPSFSLEGGRVPYQLLERTVRHDRVESPVHYPDDDLVDAARAVAWVEGVPAYGIRALSVSGAEAADVKVSRAVSGGDLWIDNDMMRVVIDASGAVRLHEREFGVSIPSLLTFEDVGDAGDLYTHSPVGPAIRTSSFLGARLLHAGPLRGELHASWRLDVPAESTRSGRSANKLPLVVSAALTLDAGARFLSVRVWGENRARDHLFRVVFSTGVTGGATWADAAFAVLRRQRINAPPTSAEEPPRTAPLHRYVSLFSEERGATLFSDGLAEYETTEDGSIAVTLVRAVGELSRNDLPERPGHAGWPVSTPEAQSLGDFAGHFALMFHGPRDVRCLDEIERAADDVLLPLVGTTLRSALRVPEPVSGVSLEGAGLAFSACKDSEDGEWLVLRCVNVSEREAAGRWRLPFVAREARLGRLDETPGAALPVRGDAVEFRAGAGSVLTVIVK
jgi:alpha-mannosidase